MSPDRTSDAQRATEALLRAVVRQTTDLVLVLDDRVVVSASPSAIDLVGHDLVGVELAALMSRVHPDDLPTAVARFTEIWQHAGTHDAVELRVRDAAGTWRVVELAATNLTDEPAIGGIVMSGRDVTARRAEEERRRHQREVMGLLAAGAAHDFRNLLGVVANCTQLARRQLPGDHPAQGELDTIELTIARASELTHQLLQFGGTPPGRVDRFDLGDLVAEVVSLVARQVEPDDASVRFTVDAEGAVPVDADRRRIERALLNVVLNARNASFAGSTVSVSVAVADVDPPGATRRGIEPGAYAVVTVRDTGTGMEPEVLARAFEPFFTTSPDARGSGLGLAAASDAVERAGGCIELTSSPGRGTTVTIHLPLAR